MADDAIGHMKMSDARSIENSKASSTWSVLPAGCAAPNVNGTTYFLCGNLPFDGANGIYYRVVPTP